MALGYGNPHRSAVSDADSAQYHEFNLSAFYALSKRTWLYGLIGYQQASGATLDVWRNAVVATASLTDVSNGTSSANGRRTGGEPAVSDGADSLAATVLNSAERSGVNRIAAKLGSPTH